MIILPDRNISRSKFLMPIHKKYWQTTSQSQLKDEFGNENKTRFRVRARLNDGFIKWTGWFDDREDFDAFLWAIQTDTLKYERSLWSLPEVAWSPDIGEMLSYDFASVTFLTSPVDTLSTTWTVPNDWNDNKNTIECIGGGGAGGAQRYSLYPKASGGGGGGYGKYTNLNLTKGSTPQWQIGGGYLGTTDSNVGATGANGQDGSNTWFNGGTYAAASVGARGGAGGTYENGSGTIAAASGGIGKGTSSYSGGAGGAVGAGTDARASGGGGAAGPYGAGGSANQASNTVPYTNGGSGGNELGGFGGPGDQEVASPPDGGDGYEWTTVGSGGGGGGTGLSYLTGGNGGRYGAGGGGAAATNSNVTGGRGRQGIIVITYTPVSAGLRFNMPHQGM